MPEVITKHPDVVKEVLESAGAKCGAGAPQKILKKCPREQFCALPGGEICVYPVSGIPEMTQLTRAELCEPRGEARPPGAPSAEVAAAPDATGVLLGTLAVAAVLGRRRRWR